MRTEKLIQDAERALERHGFQSAVNRFPPDCCFDMIAKSEDSLLVIKTAHDLLEVPRGHVEELCAISRWVSATPLLLAERMGDEELDDDAVYIRHGAYAISLGALERSLEGDPPLVEVSPLGCYVYIDGEAMRKRREELGLSVGELARLVGVSRMTIYSYEKGRRRTTPDVAYKLEYVLGIPIVVPVDPLKRKAGGRHQGGSSPSGGLLGLVARLLGRLKLMVRALSKAPFEMMVKHDGEMINVVLNVIHKRSYDAKRINSTREFVKLAGLHHLVIRPNDYECPGDVRSVAIDELKSLRRPEEFAQLLTT